MTTAAHSTAENLPITIRYLPLVFWFVPTFGFINKNLLKFDLYYFFYHKWHFDNVYNSINNRVLVWYYRCTFLFLDKGLFEYVGPRGASALFFLSSLIRRVQTGRVYDYAGFMLTFCYTFLVFVYFQIPKVKCDDVVLADLNFSLSVEW
jgi:NADH:ubiquinone oxidoreductase subunit 5 (subunit L)/multisubunit Na+/H+ antiporter MnhA subunit